MFPLVITTINKKTEAIQYFEDYTEIIPIIIGDKKGPESMDTRGEFYNLDTQLKLDSAFAKICPTGHYARKNIGYIQASKLNSELIMESDDDNIPRPGWYKSWPKMSILSKTCKARKENEWVNVYEFFSDKKIWPRGYPLSLINSKGNYDVYDSNVNIGVWQGLANGEPDVDAIYRLTNSGETYFHTNQIVLEKGTYCPINSQNTVWLSKFVPLMYLPCSVAFRYTDILRGIIAQHLLFHYDYTVGFCSANVFQNRNEHNLVHDFEDEITMYKHQENILDILKSVRLTSGCQDDDMLNIYEALAAKGVVQPTEIDFLKAYLKDLKL